MATNKDTAKKKQRRKQGAAAIAAAGKESLFTRGGKYGGKVKVSESVSLAKEAKGDKGPVARRIVRESDEFHPSERAAAREHKPSLGETLAGIAKAVGPGRSKIGAAISGGVSGAAIGATIGESLGKRKKRKKGTEQSE